MRNSVYTQKKLVNLDNLLIIYTVFGNAFTLLELSITYFLSFSTIFRKKISKNRKNEYIKLS